MSSHMVPAGVVLKCYMWPRSVCSDNRQLMYVGTHRQPCGHTHTGTNAYLNGAHTVPKVTKTFSDQCTIGYLITWYQKATVGTDTPPHKTFPRCLLSIRTSNGSHMVKYEPVNQLSSQRTLVSYTHTSRLYSVTYTVHQPPIWSQSTKGRTWRCDGRHEGMISGYSSCEVWRKQYQRTPQILRSNTTTVQQQSKNINMHVCMYVCM